MALTNIKAFKFKQWITDSSMTVWNVKGVAGSLKPALEFLSGLERETVSFTSGFPAFIFTVFGSVSTLYNDPAADSQK